MCSRQHHTCHLSSHWALIGPRDASPSAAATCSFNSGSRYHRVIAMLATLARLSIMDRPAISARCMQPSLSVLYTVHARLRGALAMHPLL